jgi:(S)-2-hydroxyglutarate dehydrogenase
VTYDIAIVGTGIVGLATARALLDKAPRTRIVMLEKERDIAQHQTGHNSGVIHSGIYYKPGSYKARLCVEGARLMKAFCEKAGIGVENCGKVIVATSQDEVPRLKALYERGVANGVPGLAMIDTARLGEIEPHAAAVAAIHSPMTAIVDYSQVARAFCDELVAAGVTVERNFRVASIARRAGTLRLQTPDGRGVEARHLVNCAGLYSDVIARLAEAPVDVQIVPFRGEYYMIRPEKRSLVRGLIYPVPDPQFPFLGVHFTRTVHGDVEAGPNAVLALAREGYDWRTVRPAELLGTLRFAGFRAVARKYWKTGAYEVYRSLFKSAFVAALQRLVPAIRSEDITPGGAGIRAQAVSRDGALLDDFSIVQSPDAIHVLNAPSPAATASLAIGRHIATLAAETFALGGRSTPER